MQWSFSKYLIQSFPPDRSESGDRWTFGIFEILDERKNPIDPRVLHVVYCGAVEMPAEDVPDPKDPLFTPKLEESVIKRWKAAR
ncbi:MAG: hypothetical protein JKY65_15365 [Planctomycetes bacterium]|nr:hypothetical protein [Planctomycetota bacterium]